VFRGSERKLEKGLEIESQAFGELAMTRQSQSLIHLFHATTHIKKHPYKEAGKAKFGSEKTKEVGIIGAGFMGAGIATVCSDKGIRVRMSDPNKESLGRAMKHARDYFAKKAKRKRIQRFQVDSRMAAIAPGTTPSGFEKVDVVIEAVFEDIDLKRKLLAQTEAKAGDGWIFASNTSALPIADIAAQSKHPERVLGMHFFSPVEKMPLLEVIVTDKTADWVTARVVELGQTLGKQVIVVKDGPGFYTTRALSFYLNEAALMLAEGAKIDKVDKALTDFGFPVGPITLIDEVGIDVGSHVLETMQKAFPDRIQVPEGMTVVLDSGRLGRKNQKGFYKYSNGEKGAPDEAIYEMLAGYKTEPKGIPQDEIVDRCMLLFVNESVRCLEEGILASPYDGDVGAVFGLGFPPFWGGPFRYVDHLGATTIVDRLRGLADKYGKRFEPAAMLVDYAKTNKAFFPDEAGQ
jgi:3-hydroxyacyl-CoA dehydrogenase/enoyl-CoA hydratase/3-hydroxybutyryl-CoA epimerase